MKKCSIIGCSEAAKKYSRHKSHQGEYCSKHTDHQRNWGHPTQRINLSLSKSEGYPLAVHWVLNQLWNDLKTSDRYAKAVNYLYKYFIIQVEYEDPKVLVRLSDRRYRASAQLKDNPRRFRQWIASRWVLKDRSMEKTMRFLLSLEMAEALAAQFSTTTDLTQWEYWKTNKMFQHGVKPKDSHNACKRPTKNQREALRKLSAIMGQVVSSRFSKATQLASEHSGRYQDRKIREDRDDLLEALKRDGIDTSKWKG